MAANGCYSCVPERIGAWKCLVSEEKPLAFKINRPKIQVMDGRNNVKSTAQSVYFCPQNYILYVHAY